MKREIHLRFLIVIALAVLTLLFTLPSSTFGEGKVAQYFDQFKITLGLDLAGGTELDYKTDLSSFKTLNSDEDAENDVSLEEQEEILNRVRDAIKKRVDPAEIGEIVVKRSQFDNEEHILVQMPPSGNVDQAKKDAERDNRLEFFEENPEKESIARVKIATILTELTPENWENQKEELKTSEGIVSQAGKNVAKSDIIDQAMAEKIFADPKVGILNEVITTQTEIEATVDDQGQVVISNYPQQILGIVNVTNFGTKDKEITNKGKAEARHILFAYEGATRAAEDVPYKTKEEAQAKAEEIFAQIQAEGTENFGELAKEYSNGPTSVDGGNLGEFESGAMATAFNDAVFNSTENGLINEVVETPFGFHIIDIISKTDETTTTETVPVVSYDIIGWPTEDIRWEATELSGKQLEKATSGTNEIGQPLVNLRFNREGANLFGEITDRVSKRRCDGGACSIGIKVGGELVTRPTVTEKINSRDAQITGSFTIAETKALANNLNLGAIDVPISLVGQINIQPELGKEQLNKTLEAGLIGLAITMLFMIAMYRFAGVIAALALILYGGMFFMLLKIWPESLGGPIVLSLSGAAGIILSLGLAVDGNILIFERMKEEIARGKNIHQAIELGFARAWNAIKDSNFTTFITCFILFIFGSAMIKGFAITLIVGTLLSMFTAVIVSRNLLRFFALIPGFDNPKLYGVSGKIAKKANKKVKKNIRKRK